MFRTGVTRIDFPISALALAISTFETTEITLPLPPTLATLLAVRLPRCEIAVKRLSGGGWRARVSYPWPATSAVVVEGTGETIERTYADFGKGRVGLPRQLLLALLAAKVEGVTADTVLAGKGEGATAHPARWESGDLGTLCTYLVGNPPALAPV